MSSEPTDGSDPTGRWDRLSEIFEHALGLPAEERRAWVEAECGDDVALAAAVVSLLDSDGCAGTYLAGPLGDEAPRPPQEGESIGPYRLVGPLGEGGMSTVYRALQEVDGFEREVALKVIRRGLESAETRRRFRLERRILASLEHPAIARFYDGGMTAAGLPYLVMEKVDGRPIDEHCDEVGLGVDQRIDIFRRVCAAVHHAHQNLVVHRDLKPTNVLVTADGEPRLLDFGIAKLLDPGDLAPDAEPTVAWLRLVTPGYASPEQVRGEAVTTASDVFSLGALLYKLLTGRLPHDLSGLTLAEAEAAVAEAPPLASSRVEGPERRRRLAGDLDRILAKALHPDPERRYASAHELAADLERHRTGYPVEARPDAYAYRATRFLARHRAAVAVAGFVFLLVCGAAVALAVQAAEVTRERDRLASTIGFVKSVFAVTREGEELSVREAVDRSARALELTPIEQPTVEATLRDVLGAIYLDLGQPRASLEQLERAVELRREVLGENHLETAESMRVLGVARVFNNQEQGVEMTERALAIAERQLDADDPRLAYWLSAQVKALCLRGQFAEAAEPSRRAVELARRLPEGSVELPAAIAQRAIILGRDGDDEAAMALYQEALVLYRRYRGDDYTEIASLLSNLSNLHRRAGDLAAAEGALRQTVELERRLYAGDSANLAYSLYKLGRVLLERGEMEEAEALMRESQAMFAAIYGSHDWTAALTVTGLARVLHADGREAEAAALLETGLADWLPDLAEHPAVVAAEEQLVEWRG